jgi:hypothetical protein
VAAVAVLMVVAGAAATSAAVADVAVDLAVGALAEADRPDRFAVDRVLAADPTVEMLARVRAGRLQGRAPGRVRDSVMRGVQAQTARVDSPVRDVVRRMRRVRLLTEAGTPLVAQTRVVAPLAELQEA